MQKDLVGILIPKGNNDIIRSTRRLIEENFQNYEFYYKEIEPESYKSDDSRIKNDITEAFNDFIRNFKHFGFENFYFLGYVKKFDTSFLEFLKFKSNRGCFFDFESDFLKCIISKETVENIGGAGALSSIHIGNEGNYLLNIKTEESVIAFSLRYILCSYLIRYLVYEKAISLLNEEMLLEDKELYEKLLEDPSVLKKRIYPLFQNKNYFLYLCILNLIRNENYKFLKFIKDLEEKINFLNLDVKKKLEINIKSLVKSYLYRNPIEVY
jgi:hypothetical protein